MANSFDGINLWCLFHVLLTASCT